MKKIKIIHLYPDEMNLYGDGGNVLCLYKRLLWRGYKVDVTSVGIGDKINDFDILFIGGGQDKEMNVISRDLKLKSDMLCYSVRQGKVILGICGGFQILGEYYETSDKNRMNLTGALPFYTLSGVNRFVGNIVVETPFGKIVGFENHAGRTFLDNNLNKLGRVVCGYGNNGKDLTEGVLYKNTFGTYLHGPVLPKNPKFADEIIKRATESDLLPLDDDLENKCNNFLIERFE